MAPPSPLAIATSSLLRLIKEEASYHKELQQQETRIQKLAAQDQSAENVEFTLRQERKALRETEAVFPELRRRIRSGLVSLKELINESPGEGNEAEVKRAEDAIVAAKSIREGEAVS